MNVLLSANGIEALITLLVAAFFIRVIYKNRQQKMINPTVTQTGSQKRSTTIMWIAAVSMISLAIMRFVQSTSPEAQLNNILTGTAQALNRKAPLAIDSYTRLDKASVSDQELILTHTLLTSQKININTELFKKEMQKSLETICKNEAYKSIFSRGGLITFEYRSSEQVEIAHFMFVPSMCGYKDNEQWIIQRNFIREAKKHASRTDENSSKRLATMVTGPLPLFVASSGNILKEGGVLTESIGIETRGGVFSPIVKAGLQTPVKKEKVFSTVEDNQSHLNISLFRGKDSLVKGNYSLGTFQAIDIPRAPKGVPKISISVTVNNEGIFLTAVDLGTKRELKMLKM